MPEVLQYATCKHVLASGRICGSPAMKDHIFCYSHQRNRQRRANLRAALGQKFRNGEETFDAEVVASLDLPAPDDPESTIVCLSQTFLALAAGAIPEKRAALMIYNLQTVTSAYANLLKQRQLEAERTSQTGQLHEMARAVTDPEPIPSLLTPKHLADSDFSEQRYAAKLETERLPHSERSEGWDEAETSSASLVATAAIADPATANAAFNADAERYKDLDSGALPMPKDAPFTNEEVETAANRMSDEEWEKYVKHLGICGFIDHAQEEKLRERVLDERRDVRTAARVMALKYAPDEVRKFLAKPPLEKKQPKKIAIPKSCFAQQPAS